MKRIICWILALSITGGLSAGLFAPPKPRDTAPVARVETKLPAARLLSDADPPKPPDFDDPPAPATPTVAIQESYQSTFGLVMLKATVSDQAMLPGMLWDNSDGLQPIQGVLVLQPGAAAFVAPKPGTFRVRAIAAAGNVPALSNWCLITIGTPAPTPPPGPAPPNPGPTPPPATATKLIIRTIDNAEQRTPALTKFLTDPYWQQISAKGHDVWQFNSTNAKAMASYADQIKANGGLPTIVIMDAATLKWLNKDPADLKLPGNAASLKALLQKYTRSL